MIGAADVQQKGPKSASPPLLAHTGVRTQILPESNKSTRSDSKTWVDGVDLQPSFPHKIGRFSAAAQHMPRENNP